MTLSDEIIAAALILNAGLIGVIYRSLESKISESMKEVKEVKDKATDKDTCALRTQLHEQRFVQIDSRIDGLKEQNKEYHESLVSSLGELHETVDGIRDCVTKLSAGVDCD